MSDPTLKERTPTADATRAQSDTRPSGPHATVTSEPAFGPPVEPGEVGRLGPYRLLRLLGRGGMGAVYAAIDTRLDRTLALKVMLPEFAADPVSKDRFLREARAAARVSHDNVVIIHESDERDGVPYIAMQLLEGCTLDEHLKRTGVPDIAESVRIACEAAAGLAAAHRTGLVHRDIKPGNLWLEAPSGRVKLLDFGLARPVANESELTGLGAVVGTPAFMSPEQARGEPVDHRTDLFSLGVVLYRIFTGRQPFHGPNAMAVLMALGTHDPVPARRVNPDVPASISALIDQLLAKSAEARPATAEEVLARLRTSGGPTSSSRFRMIGAAAIVLAAVGLVVLFLRDSESPKIEPPIPEPGRSEPPAAATTRSPPDSHDPERDVAKWVLSLGGAVMVVGQYEHIKSVADLPNDRFAVSAVSVAKTDIADADMVRFQACPEIYYFQMEGTKLTDKSMAVLAAMPKLIELHLPRTGITNTGVSAFAGNRTLTAIDLSGTKVTNDGLAHFAACRQLAFLDLREMTISDAGLKHFAECRQLVHLTLINADITDDGMAHLRECVKLQHVDLSSTKVTDITLARLESCRDLGTLIVRGTGVTEKGVAKFHAAVPKCEIEHDTAFTPPKK